MHGLRYGSFFAGIGGFDLGFDRAGFDCVFQVEIDPFCRRVLAKHWPTVPKFEDIREVSGAMLPPVDVLIGGFPCQDLSAAGAKGGIEGERSGLWREFYRIICEGEPVAISVENVPGLLVRGMGTVCGNLAARGYDLEWDSLSAAAVNAPHIRDRVWITATRRAVSDAERDRLRKLGQWQREQYKKPGAAVTPDDGPPQSLANTHGQRRKRIGQSDDNSNEQSARGRIIDRRRQRWTGAAAWPPEPGICRMVDGVPDRVDRLRSLGNAIVPQCAELIARRLLDQILENVGDIGDTLGTSNA